MRLFSALAESFIPRSFLVAPPFSSDRTFSEPALYRCQIREDRRRESWGRGGSKQRPEIYCDPVSSEPGLKLRPGFMLVE